jgi:small subunit ribosomal protein S1
MKQLVPTGLDEYLAEHKEGDTVTGRILDISGTRARVELGQGIQATALISSHPQKYGAPKKEEAASQEHANGSPNKPDLSSLGSMLQARWKSGAPAGSAKPEELRVGQVHTFRIAKLDAEAKKIDLELQ